MTTPNETTELLPCAFCGGTPRRSTLGEQVSQAQAEMATWTPEKRASVRLEGGGQSHAAPATATASADGECAPCNGMGIVDGVGDACPKCDGSGSADSAADARDAARWRFMMRVAQNPDGPESAAMDKFGQELSEDGNEGEQMGMLVDAAIAVIHSKD